MSNYLVVSRNVQGFSWDSLFSKQRPGSNSNNNFCSVRNTHSRNQYLLKNTSFFGYSSPLTVAGNQRFSHLFSLFSPRHFALCLSPLRGSSLRKPLAPEVVNYWKSSKNKSCKYFKMLISARSSNTKTFVELTTTQTYCTVIPNETNLNGYCTERKMGPAILTEYKPILL